MRTKITTNFLFGKPLHTVHVWCVDLAHWFVAGQFDTEDAARAEAFSWHTAVA